MYLTMHLASPMDGQHAQQRSRQKSNQLLVYRQCIHGRLLLARMFNTGCK
jgi:hypothetical protein